VKVTSTVRRRGKIIGRATAVGEDGSVEPFKRAAEEAGRQAKAHEAAIKSSRHAYRRKRKVDEDA
jgi:hypothetical protein